VTDENRIEMVAVSTIGWVSTARVYGTPRCLDYPDVTVDPY
jgi:hypothetical protein